jgi:hypothetical protein
MHKLQELHLYFPKLTDGFLRPDLDGQLANRKLLPSLRRLRLQDTILHESPVIPHPSHRTSGGQRILLMISHSGGPLHICKDVLKEMEGLVEELVLDLTLDDACPFGYCSVSGEEEQRRCYPGG